MTAQTRWELLSSAQFTTRMQYDIAGNARSATDPKGNTTTFEFSDRYGSPDNEAQSNTVPSELTNPPRTTYAFTTRVTNALSVGAQRKR